MSKKDYKGALAALSKALDLLPGWIAANKKNDKPRMVEIAKSDGNRVLRRGEAFEKNRQAERGYFGLRTGSSGVPKELPFRRSLLRAYRKVGQDEKALALVTQLLQEDDAPDLFYKRAEIYKKLGKEAQANVDIARARKSENSLMGSDRKLAD